MTSSRRCSRTRRRQLVHEVQVKIRDARTDSTLERDVLDQGESSEVDIQDAIGFALIQMKAETLNKIDAALAGSGKARTATVSSAVRRSPEPRLRALPFAVRCKDCEEARETVERRERVMAQRRGSSALFLDLPT